SSKSRPPMLNKENYVPWSSRLLRYAKSRPNGNLIHKSILNGLYVRRMIPELGDANREVTVTETFHVQTHDELSDKELKKIEADDQAIQTILLGEEGKVVQRMGKMVGGNGGNQFRQYARNSARYNDVIGNQVIQNVVQNPRVQNTGNQNRLIGVQGNVNQNQIRNEEYDLMAAPADLDEIEEVIANCILMANMQQASTSGTQTDSDPVYDSDRSAENDNDVISEDTSVEQGGETVEQHPVNFEETRLI
nr:hypothetical protein [Tanacetum cinerariifolium]